MTHSDGHVTRWSDDEAAFLRRYVTNLHLPVFALVNLPEVVKGALFARYSRSHKDLRRLLVDEFSDDLTGSEQRFEAPASADSRAAGLYRRVFDGFGDDSVADLGSAHLACEEVSNILTKILERGRLMSYLEQSTRYIKYDTPLRGRWRYCLPEDIPAGLTDRYTTALDTMFESYSEATETVIDWLRDNSPRPDGTNEQAWNATLRSKALDATRGMLPAATLSNVGIHGSGRAFEALLLRMLSHPLAEARSYATMMLTELRQVIPEFLHRVDNPEYGGVAIEYRQQRQDALAQIAKMLPLGMDPVNEQGAGISDLPVELLDWDPYAERRVAAAALFPHLGCSETTIRDALARVAPETVAAVFDAIRGERKNRRHRPGRELEAVVYRFKVISDYGAYRDLQRHRMLTIEAQQLGTSLGYGTPELISEAGAAQHWQRALDESERAHRLLADESPAHASYPVAMAFRLRYVMQFNAREAMHMIELRSQPQGHPSYRRIVQEMLRQIENVAGHALIASLFTHADMSEGDQGRLEAEQRSEQRRQAAA